VKSCQALRVELESYKEIIRYVLQHTQQDTATHCNTLESYEEMIRYILRDTTSYCQSLQHSATHSNTLPCTATHCNALHRTTTHCNALQRTATHCNTATLCSTLERYREIIRYTLQSQQRTATRRLCYT